eukprot:7549277-Pyramimonas_sp.AAC.1
MGAKRLRSSGAEGGRGTRKAARAAMGRLSDNIRTKRVMSQCAEFAATFFEWAHGQASRPSVLNLDQLNQ